MMLDQIRLRSRAPRSVDPVLTHRWPGGFRSAANRGLSGHVRQLQKRHDGVSRWLLLALLGGGAVALAMVQIGIR